MILGGIYKIRNIINNKIYIGSAEFFNKRWREHLNLLKRNKSQRYLQNSWNKYGEQNFVFEIIEIIEDKNLLVEREQYYLDILLFAQEFINGKDKRFLKLGYNISPTARNLLGVKLSKKTKRKISESHKGLKASDEARKKMSLSKTGKLNNRYGITHSEKTKKIMSKKGGKGLRGKFGKLHHASKKVAQINNEGQILEIFDCMKDIERKLGFARPNISKCCNGHLKKAYSFYWKFV